MRGCERREENKNGVEQETERRLLLTETQPTTRCFGLTADGGALRGQSVQDLTPDQLGLMPT